MNYSARVTWTGNRGEGTASYVAYGRDYRVEIDGKPPLLGSADAAFRGDRGRHNPEDLFLASLASCHMLLYLALCAKNGISVQDYADEAQATLTFDPRGGGQFESVMLQPKVTLSADSDPVLAAALHDQAHEQCFIARSCRVPITHRARIRRQGEVLP